MADRDTLATRLQRAMEYVPGPQWSLVLQAFVCQVCNGKGGPAPHDVAHTPDCLFAPLRASAPLSGTDLDAIEARAAAATRGPWRWFGNVKTRQVYLATTHSGRRFILQFWRWGTRDAQPVFQIDGRMVKLEEMAARGVVRVDHNREIVGVNHPDALFIERAREDVDALTTEVRQLRTRIDRAMQRLAAGAVDEETMDDVWVELTGIPYPRMAAVPFSVAKADTTPPEQAAHA